MKLVYEFRPDDLPRTRSKKTGELSGPRLPRKNEHKIITKRGQALSPLSKRFMACLLAKVTGDENWSKASFAKVEKECERRRATPLLNETVAIRVVIGSWRQDRTTGLAQHDADCALSPVIDALAFTGVIRNDVLALRVSGEKVYMPGRNCMIIEIETVAQEEHETDPVFERLYELAFSTEGEHSYNEDD